MKKRLILLLAILCFSSEILRAQTISDIYIVGTSIVNPQLVPGFNRANMTKKSGDRNPTIVFEFFSQEKDYTLDFWHLDYIESPNDIVDLPMSRLTDFQLIEVDDFIKTHDKKEALKWFVWAFDETSYDNEGKRRIWIIDRNDFYKSSPSLTAPDRMKLIPVIIFPESLPELINFD